MRSQGGMMTGERCRPGRRFVPDAATAAGDLKAPRSRDAGEYKVVGAVVMSRDASGNVNGRTTAAARSPAAPGSDVPDNWPCSEEPALLGSQSGNLRSRATRSDPRGRESRRTTSGSFRGFTRCGGCALSGARAVIAPGPSARRRRPHGFVISPARTRRADGPDEGHADAEHERPDPTLDERRDPEEPQQHDPELGEGEEQRDLHRPSSRGSRRGPRAWRLLGS